MLSRTLWVGPVSREQIHATSSTTVVPCIGAPDGSNTEICRDDVPKIAAFATGGPFVLRGFSAGGHAIKRYLLDKDARDRVAAVVLSDASFEDAPGAFAEGFVLYGSEAANQMPGRVFVATAGSSGTSTHGVTDSAAMETLRQKIEERTGKRFQAITAPWAPKPLAKGWQLGSTVLLDFGGSFSHGEHATALAEPVWQNVVAPLLAAPAYVAAPEAPPPAPMPTMPAPAARPYTPPGAAPVPATAPATVPWVGPMLAGRPLLPAVLVAGGAGLFIYALVHTFRRKS